VIDVVAIPKGLEHQIGEAEHQDVLNRALAQVVIDAIDLRLAETALQAIEDGGALQVEAEGLLHHQPGPAPSSAFRPWAARLIDDAAVVLRRHRQIGHEVGRDAPSARSRSARRRNRRPSRSPSTKCIRPSRRSSTRVGCAGQAARQPRPDLLAPVVIRPGAPAESDDARLRMKALRRLDVIERREQLDAHQVAGRAEDQDGAGIQHGLGASIADKCDNVSPVILLPSRAYRAGNRFARI
jgi:hypothetical protein